MTKLIDAILVVGFLFVDFLFFHDALGGRDVITFAEYLVGTLGLVVIVRSVFSLLSDKIPNR